MAACDSTRTEGPGSSSRTRCLPFLTVVPVPSQTLVPYLVLGLLVLAPPQILSAQALHESDSVATYTADNLRPGDAVRLRIWREPDLSGEFPVDAQGIAVLPKLGRYEVARTVPDSLQPQLVRAYGEYLNNPSVEVVLLRRVSVLGAVQKPGLYPVDPTMTVSDVLALAGGAAAHGKPNQVELRRENERIVAKLDQTSRIADLPIRSGDQLYVPQRSWLSRNTGLLAGFIGTAASLTVVLTR